MGFPLSRFSLAEVQRWLIEEGVVGSVSATTLWRWLRLDALRPWFYRSWMFPRDPLFLEKAGAVLDLYHRRWQGQPLGPKDYVLSADEKTQIQALGRHAPVQPPVPGRTGRYDSEYIRGGTLAYLAALDVFSGRVWGRIDQTTGIEPFGKLVDNVMQQQPYANADRVFWIVDNGPSHHPNTFPARLNALYPNTLAVNVPFHASWLNQIELYFSVLQRKALTPNDLATKQALTERILGFEDHYNHTAKPFRWNFTRHDLAKRMRLLDAA